MRASNLFFPTLREVPADAEIISHKLLLRAGFIRKVAAGIYDYLPLGYKVLKKINKIVNEEMNSKGAQEMMMPALLPAELYQETGRWDLDVLFRLKDRNDRDMLIGFTHEEVVTDIVRRDVRSYKELPLNLYQIQTKGRDEARPRAGLVRGREFVMLDSYSFDRSWEDLDRAYEKMFIAFSRVFARCGVEVQVVEAESGAIGGKENQEFMALTDAGEDSVLICPDCGYAANAERCEIGEREIPPPQFEQQELKLVDTPDMKTIEDVAKFLKTRVSRLVKTLIYRAGDDIIAALVRGDRELNEAKLARAVGVKSVEMADADTVENLTGAAVGFAGPVGLNGAKIIADREIAGMVNVVVGGNKTDTHYTNANLDRDFKIDSYADLRTAEEGDACPKCECSLTVKRGMEVGHIFKLGTIYSDAMDAAFLDADGKEKPFIMGCYGMGVSRLLSVVPEVSNDADGMIWPISIAPFEASIVLINSEDEEQCQAAVTIYEELMDAGVDVLLDERDERPGVKFKDMDLLGIPIQIVCGKLANEGKAEIKLRTEKEKRQVDVESASADVLELRRRLYLELTERAQKFG